MLFYSETLDDDQSVYKQIVDRLEDLQRIHQELVIQTAESGIHKDPKTFESKQKGILTISTQKGPVATWGVAKGPYGLINNPSISLPVTDFSNNFPCWDKIRF